MTARRTALGVLAVVALALTASCASIPEESEPKVVKAADNDAPTPESVEPPPDDLDPLGLVRNFINSAAAPANDHAAARLHLTPEAAATWRAPSEVLVVDRLNTYPAEEPPDAPANVRMVTLLARKVGRLRPDRSFATETGTYNIRFRLEQQVDGEWRIANPPRRLVVNRPSFKENYRSVPIHFLDKQRDGMVQDRRYVLSRPASTVPARVIDLLLSGPSQPFRAAMNTALPPDASTATNVSEAGNGALVVNFNDLGELRERIKRQIAAQVVLSLQNVSNARVRLLEEGTALLADQPVLRPRDVAGFASDNDVRTDVRPLAVVDARLLVLDKKAPPIPGPAGAGKYEVVTAARSGGGSRIAAVVRESRDGVALRVGGYGGSLDRVGESGSFMTRPSWRGESEVWTVVDGTRVVRAIREDNGGWTVREVDATAFRGGGRISSLRVSRDGTRVAGVVDGRIVVAGIVGNKNSLALQRPTTLNGHLGEAKVTGVEWLSSDSLVAVTDSGTDPVIEVTVDGFSWDSYESANLRQPVAAVTVGPENRVIVADRNGLWRSDDQDELWELLPGVPIGGRSIPFYPG